VVRSAGDYPIGCRPLAATCPVCLRALTADAGLPPQRTPSSDIRPGLRRASCGEPCSRAPGRHRAGRRRRCVDQPCPQDRAVIVNRDVGVTTSG